MIFVTLGTQDKGFPRLLEAIDREIEKGNIREKVVVQAGLTDYKSSNMEIFDLISPQEFDNYINESRLVITHGGAGSILSAIKKGKKVIAAARLSKYKEHTNDHQRQIVKEFSAQGYILELKDFNKLDKVLEKCESFKPKKFESNTDNMIKLIENYIEDSNHISWYNECRMIISHLGFIALTDFLSFLIFRLMHNNIYTSIIIAWFISLLFYFVFKKNSKKYTNFIRGLFSGILLLVSEIGIMYLFINFFCFNEYISKIIFYLLILIFSCNFKKIGGFYNEK